MAVYEITVTVCTPESDAYYVQVGQAMGEEIMDYAESRVRDRLWPRGSTVSECNRLESELEAPDRAAEGSEDDNGEG